ncbi:MAG TPA: hypothetical protein VFU49_17520 [Ktedonobacteraceae bacterium]|nr:hypothetical protein [Ktedonobacteraceae bacterium]
MPERLAYDEAMLFSPVRLKVQDPELKQGKVEMVSVQTAINSVNRPWGIEGGFAVVYKFRTRSGQMRALRCFRVPVPADTRYRYERIGAYFQAHAREITAGFKYHDAAIVVKEQGKAQNLSYPIIEMDWIDGATLVEHVDELCKRRDQGALKDLANRWLNLLRIMRNAHIAHGDLSGVNIMVRDDGKLLLVDYDGVYIPELAGRSQVVLGQEDYQHPEMAQRQFHEHMDGFSAFVIYTALIALARRPELWQKYGRFSAEGKLQDVNLLFRKQDFQEPHLSPLMRDLGQIPDQHIRNVLRKLKQLCQQPVNDVQFPLELIDPEHEKKFALEQLERALSTDDDEQIANCWNALLAQHGPAQQYRGRVQLAQRRVNALRTFRAALRSGEMRQILDSYDAILDSSPQVTAQERGLYSLIRQFFQAEQDGNDAELLKVADILLNARLAFAITFTPEQRQRVAEARQRKRAEEDMRAGLQSRQVERIAQAYTVLQRKDVLTPEERKRAELAAAFLLACDNDDDDAIIQAYASIENSPQRYALLFSEAQEQRVTLASQRIQKLAAFRRGLASRSPARIVEAYHAVLDGYNQITREERIQLALARKLAQAFEDGQEDVLLAAYTALEQSAYQAFFIFSEEEQERIVLARRQKAALLAFQAALRTRDPRQIVAAYEPILDNSRHISPAEYTQLEAARLFLAAYYANDNEALLRAVDALSEADPSFTPLLLNPQEQQRVDLARQHQRALETFRAMGRSGGRSARTLINAYDAAFLDASASLTGEERKRIDDARRYLSMYEQLRQGMSQNDDAVICHAYDPELARLFAEILPEEQQRIDNALLSQELEGLLKNRAYGQALRLAYDLQAKTGRSVNDSLLLKLQKATLRFIKEHQLQHMIIQIKEYADGNYAQVQWQWPTDNFIQKALFLWHHNRPLEQSLERNMRQRDPEMQSGWIERRGNGSDGVYLIPMAANKRIYVRGYTAICDEWDREKHWRFSDGVEGTSYMEETSSHVS